jgi:membrane-associated phospholipid phosphatase
LSAGWHGRLICMLRSWLALPLSIALTATTARAEPTLEWNEDWPRFRTSEAVVTGSMLLPIAGALFLYPHPEDNMHGGVLFDDAVRDALVADSKEGRGMAATWSNWPYLGLLAFPFVVDTALVAWGVHGAGDVALEMLAMNLESFAITGAEKGCASDPNYAGKCDDPVAMNQSFVSGHTAVAFTGAGLTCAHHRHLPLYGGGAPDAAICVVGLAAASATGVLRIMSDDHYSTDVLLGVALGLGSGWLLPEWLHYGGGADKNQSGSLLPMLRPEGSTLSAIVAPQLAPGFLGLTLRGGY